MSSGFEQALGISVFPSRTFLHSNSNCSSMSRPTSKGKACGSVIGHLSLAHCTQAILEQVYQISTEHAAPAGAAEGIQPCHTPCVLSTSICSLSLHDAIAVRQSEAGEDSSSASFNARMKR